MSSLDIESGSTKTSLIGVSSSKCDAEHVDQKKKVRTARAILKLARPFFFDVESRKMAWALSIFLIMILVGESITLVKFSTIQKDYMTALQQKDVDGFYVGIWAIFKVLLLFPALSGAHNSVQAILGVQWRARVTRTLTKEYLAGNSQRPAFFAMHLDGFIDNPDQRICDDAEKLVTNSIDLVVKVSGGVFKGLGFVVVLYNISHAGCIGLVTYSLVITLIGVFGFGPLIFKYRQLMTKQEADMRYCLIRVRENAESVAFFQGGLSEWYRFEEMFNTLVATIYRCTVVTSSFEMLRQFSSYAIYPLPALMVAPAYLRGEIEFGVISQAGFAFMMIKFALLQILSELDAFASLAVQVSRLAELEEGMQANESSSYTPVVTLQETDDSSKKVLALMDFTLRTPARRGGHQQTLFSNLSLTLSSGESMLIVGSSGIGKSSLLRGVAGLWTSGSGTVQRCDSSSVFFMPQRPYMYLGTLREQLLYPNVARTDVKSETLRETLKEVNLGYLIERYSLRDSQEWTHILSLGEQQRLNFARMLLQPSLRLALIDEGTSACDPDNEAHLYDLLKKRNYSFVSVGHRPALRQYHSHALWLQQKEGPTDGNGCSKGADTQFLLMEDFIKLGPVRQASEAY